MVSDPRPNINKVTNKGVWYEPTGSAVIKLRLAPRFASNAVLHPAPV